MLVLCVGRVKERRPTRVLISRWVGYKKGRENRFRFVIRLRKFECVEIEARVGSEKKTGRGEGVGRTHLCVRIVLAVVVVVQTLVLEVFLLGLGHLLELLLRFEVQLLDEGWHQ